MPRVPASSPSGLLGIFAGHRVTEPHSQTPEARDDRPRCAAEGRRRTPRVCLVRGTSQALTVLTLPESWTAYHAKPCRAGLPNVGLGGCEKLQLCGAGFALTESRLGQDDLHLNREGG